MNSCNLPHNPTFFSGTSGWIQKQFRGKMDKEIGVLLRIVFLIMSISGMAIPPIFGLRWPNIGYKAKRPVFFFKYVSKSEKAKIWEDEVIWGEVCIIGFLIAHGPYKGPLPRKMAKIGQFSPEISARWIQNLCFLVFTAILRGNWRKYQIFLILIVWKVFLVIIKHDRLAILSGQRKNCAAPKRHIFWLCYD